MAEPLLDGVEIFFCALLCFRNNSNLDVRVHGYAIDTVVDCDDRRLGVLGGYVYQKALFGGWVIGHAIV